MTEITKAQEKKTQVEGYGDREDVKEMSDRLMKMLPGVKSIGTPAALALAQVAISLDLNPLTGEVWAIPQSGGSFAIMAGIKGLRRAARAQAMKDGGLYQAKQRLPTAEEIDGVTLKAGDIARACDIFVFTKTTMIYMKLTGKPVMFTGLGIFRAGDKSKMEPVMLARKRAEADALKQAFDLPFGIGGPGEQGPPVGWKVVVPLPETTVREDLELLYGSRAVANMPEPEPDPEENFYNELVSVEPEEFLFGDFVLDVLREIPYYNHQRHIENTMRKLNLTWMSAASEAIWEALEEYAGKRADEKAATESGDVASVAEQAQERMPF